MHDALMFPSFNPDKTYLQHQKDGFRFMVTIASGAVHDSINTYPDYTFAAHPAQVEFIALLTTIWYVAIFTFCEFKRSRFFSVICEFNHSPISVDCMTTLV